MAEPTLQEVEIRLRAVEFLLAKLISRTSTLEDVKADCRELKQVVDDGFAWALLPELSRADSAAVVQTAVDLLDDAIFQMGKG